MNVAVRYFSKTGNTRKLADTIGQAVDVTPADVSAKLESKVDILFLGSAVYAAGIDDAVKTFIKENADNIGCLVNFSTAALLPSTYKQVKKLAESYGIKVSDEEFHCRGKFANMHKDRPNAQDLKDAAEFAKKLVK